MRDFSLVESEGDDSGGWNNVNAIDNRFGHGVSGSDGLDIYVQ